MRTAARRPAVTGEAQGPRIALRWRRLVVADGRRPIAVGGPPSMAAIGCSRATLGMKSTGANHQIRIGLYQDNPDLYLYVDSINAF
jgi:hypothetical protein